jgi:benzoyl-CoA reductase/2-hydroxyglutaryl-CoA dehydratase subunit BcrC/BadD/HgdB
MTDIVAAAQAHLASLPQHLKSRYSAVLIANLVEEIEDLQELRKLDGESLGKSVEEYNRMKELCVNGKYLTDEEREAIEAMACYFDMRGNLTMQSWGSLLRILLERLK